MYIAMNRFHVAIGQEETFEKLWRQRESYLHEAPGFVGFYLLRGEPGEQATVFVSHSQWQSEQTFADWTQSETFVNAHRSAKIPPSILACPPRFEGYNSVALPALNNGPANGKH